MLLPQGVEETARHVRDFQIFSIAGPAAASRRIPAASKLAANRETRAIWFWDQAGTNRAKIQHGCMKFGRLEFSAARSLPLPSRVFLRLFSNSYL